VNGQGRPSASTLAAFGGVVLFGSTNLVLVRYTSHALPPFWGAGIRFTVASLVLFGLVAASRLPLPKGRALLGAMGFGLLFVTAGYGLFYWGAKDVPAGLAAVIMAATPLLTFLLAMLQHVERFRTRGLVGALLAVAGIAFVVAEPPGGAVPITAVLAIAGAAACAGESGIVVKRLPETHPFTTNAIALATGGFLLLILAFAIGEHPTAPGSATVWAALIYLSLLGTPALFILLVFVLERWTASGASYQFVLFPPVSILLGALLLGESLTWGLLIGAPLALAGVYVGALSSSSRATAEPQAGLSRPN
jgi:drug/metabolite transporter (DMT)-like permease